jgi:hypothetical protein
MMERQPLWMKKARHDTPHSDITPKLALHACNQQQQQGVRVGDVRWHVLNVDTASRAVLVVLSIHKGENDKKDNVDD